ncbi:hypothetical protein HDU81_001552 [Chytriomyces hyalinus]|nr:hypothetical protein HDU81_001552 [Chytriomyces hyalinus]
MFSNEITKTSMTSKSATDATDTTNKSTSTINASNGTTTTYKQVVNDTSLSSYALSQRGQLLSQPTVTLQQPYSSTTTAYFPAIKATASPAKGTMSATVNAMTGGKSLF